MKLCAGKTSEVQYHAKSSIIVETNYRVYGYIKSTIDSILLRFFSIPESNLANLYIGTITRSSCLRAFDWGITARMILTFLRQHVHPQIQHKIYATPETVTHQIRLWETENSRLYWESALMLDGFRQTKSFWKIGKKAIELGILIWSSQVKQVLVIRNANQKLVASLLAFIRQ